jgi:hypothetical protein
MFLPFECVDAWAIRGAGEKVWTSLRKYFPESSRRFEADDVALSSQGLALPIDQNASTRVNRSWVDVSA